MTEKAQLESKRISVRHYENGDEARIVEFLNRCYGNWGDLQKWQRLYTRYPTFNKENVFIMENNGEIVGHRGLHFRNLAIQEGHQVATATLGDTATHPDYRGRGLYAQLHEITLEEAKSKGSCFAFTWNLKGSTTYTHNRKTGFMEVTQSPAYVKILRPEKVLKAGLSDFLIKNPRLNNVLQNLEVDICFSYGASDFSLAELVGYTEKQQEKPQDKVKVFLKESSLATLVNFRNMSNFQRIRSLALLSLLGRAKVRFGSFKTFVRLCRKGKAVLGAI